MARDIEMSNDISPDTRGDACDLRSDFGGDLAGEKGIDLNVGKVSRTDGLAKATMMSYEAPPPEDYSGMAISPSDSAIYTEAPGHVGRTPEQIAAEMAEAWGYAGPANEPEGIEEPHKPEYGDSPE